MNLNGYYRILIISFFLFLICDSAKIVVYNSYFAHSHFNYLAKLADILQEAGHDVTVIIPEIDPSENVVSKKAKVIVRAPIKNVENIYDKEKFQDLMWGSGIEAWKMRGMTIDLNEKLSSQCQRLFEDKLFIEKQKSKNYDFGIFEPFDFCGYGLFKVIGVHQYAISTPMTLSEEILYAIGVPGRKVTIPSTNDYHPHMTFPERLINYFSPKLFSLLNDWKDGMGIGHIKKHADPNFSKFEVIANARYIFANTDEYMDFPRPISHKIIYLGGISCNISEAKSESLAADYKEIFDSAEDGVVLVSFGSLAKSSEMPSFNKEAFVKTFSKFPRINFIWKYEDENDTVANDLPNVFKRKWIPQKEVLAHPKLLAFITHGGMNSIIEAAHFGIPLLAISLFVDQHRNAKMLEYRKTAITLSKSDITDSNLFNSLTTLTQGNSGVEFRNNAKTLASMLASRPMSPKERFVKYVNFAIDFKDHDDHLDIKFRHQNFVFFYNLDIYAFIFIVSLIGISLFFILFKTLITVIFSNFLTKQKIV